jgi:hypothetical protein
MTAYVRLLLLLIASPVAMYVAHIFVSRMVRYLRSNVAPQIVALCIILIGNIPVVWFAWELALKQVCSGSIDCACAVAYVLLTYNALAFWYLQLLNVSETSLRVHILMELLVEGPIPAVALWKRYSANEMIATRIERMIALGQLTERKGRYVLTSSTVLVTIGRLIHYWRLLLAMPVRPE